MPPRRYYQARDGEWIRITKRGFREQCCGCGLVHVVNFRVTEAGHIEIQATVDAKASAAARKQRPSRMPRSGRA